MPHERESYSQVRLLAAEYAHGYIDRDEYRRRRAELISRIVAGDEQLEYVVPEKPAPRGDETVTRYGEAEDFDMPRMPPVLPVAIGVGVLLVALVAGTWWLVSSPSPPRAEATGSIERPAMAAGEARLHAFLEADEWSHASLDALADDWRALDADVRRDARGTGPWRRLQTRLRNRINEQQVLADYDESGEAAALEDKLRTLRETLNQD